MGKKPYLIIKIKGEDWKIRILTASKFIKEHEDCGAITIGSEKRIDFRKDEICPSHCRHEIFHAFVAESNIGSTDLSADQMEELGASIMGVNAIEIIQLADKVIEYLTEK